MGMSSFGEPDVNGGSSSSSSPSSSSSSRKGKGKGKKSSNSKQPQRGLGVAQLEKIRLHGQIAHPSANSLIHHHHLTPHDYPTNFHQMGIGDYERSGFVYGGDSQTTTTASWNPGTGILDTQHFKQPSMNRNCINLPIEDSQLKRIKKQRSNSMGSIGENSELSDSQDVDLELRLSI